MKNTFNMKNLTIKEEDTGAIKVDELNISIEYTAEEMIEIVKNQSDLLKEMLPMIKDIMSSIMADTSSSKKKK